MKRLLKRLAFWLLKRAHPEHKDALYVIHDSSDKNYRRNGKTTRLADCYIQKLFEYGEVIIKDHYPTNLASNRLMDIVLLRLKQEHNLVHPQIDLWRGLSKIKLKFSNGKSFNSN